VVVSESMINYLVFSKTFVLLKGDSKIDKVLRKRKREGKVVSSSRSESEKKTDVSESLPSVVEVRSYSG
jgi:hypothetical protein